MLNGFPYIIFVILIVSLIRWIARSRKNEEAEAIIDFNENYERCVKETLNRNENSEMKKKKEDQAESPEVRTRNLLVDALRQIGCQPEMNDDETVDVTYQGEHFHINIGGVFLNIWDLGWSSINVSDLNLPKVRLAVNLANFEFGPTVVLSDPNEDGTMYLHSRYGIVLQPELPHLEDYLRYSLDLFFKAKDNVHQQFNLLLVDDAKGKSQGDPSDVRPCSN